MNKFRRERFCDESGVWGDIARPWPCGTRRNDDADMRPSLRHLSGQFEAIQASWGLNIGEQQLKGRVLVEESPCLIGGGGLDNGISLVGKHVGRVHEDQRFVIDNERNWLFKFTKFKCFHRQQVADVEIVPKCSVLPSN